VREFMSGPLTSRGHPRVPTVGIRREFIFAEWNLDAADCSIFFAALQSQIYKKDQLTDHRVGSRAFSPHR
jgi:hypothetical protein